MEWKESNLLGYAAAARNPEKGNILPEHASNGKSLAFTFHEALSDTL